MCILKMAYTFVSTHHPKNKVREIFTTVVPFVTIERYATVIIHDLEILRPVDPNWRLRDEI